MRLRFTVLLLAPGLLFPVACLSDWSMGTARWQPPVLHRPGAAATRPPNSALSVTHLAFGSCNDAFAEQPLWPAIRRSAPEVFVWTGDIVYADVSNHPPIPGQVRDRRSLGAVRSIAELRGHYAVQKERPGYAGLRREAQAIVGIYDDHDYGKNNGGREFLLRRAAQAALLDFLDVPPDAASRRSRTGAYASHDFATPGGRLRLILLDTRYHREAPGPTADILGPEQWAWLARQLEAPARYHWIVSSIQVLPTEHPYESWARFPAARKRLLALLDRTRPDGLLLISGDRHLGELSQERTAESDFLISEITASGMTHSVPGDWSEPNQRRVGALVADLHFGLARFAADGAVELSLRDRDGNIRLRHRLPAN